MPFFFKQSEEHQNLVPPQVDPPEQRANLDDNQDQMEVRKFLSEKVLMN